MCDIYFYTRCASSLEERMKINNQLLFGKYQVIRDLGSGSFSRVFLVRHLSMEQDRAIKILPKESGSSSSRLFEARLLKSLNHPSIPVIYDIEEDESFFYIVEEYIDGETLNSFLLHQQIISPGLFFEYCEQLFEIFIYLHNFAPSPIIYRDLKPEHIIVCQNQLKLIDFGVSSFVTKSGNNFNYYGNVDFSAPECFTDNTITIQADIFSIGKLIEFLLKYTSSSFSRKFKHIIQKSTNPVVTSRFETVERFQHEFNKIKKNYKWPHLEKKVAVIGSNSGCGTSHISIALTSALNVMGYKAVYFDTHNAILKFSEEYNDFLTEKDGFFYYRNFCGVPNFQNGIQINLPKNATIIYDMGNSYSLDELYNMDLILVVCNASFWHVKDVLNMKISLLNLSAPCKFLSNLSTHKDAVTLAKILDCKVYHYPFDNDVFYLSAYKEKLIPKLLSVKGGYKSFLKGRRISNLLRR